MNELRKIEGLLSHLTYPLPENLNDQAWELERMGGGVGEETERAVCQG